MPRPATPDARQVFLEIPDIAPVLQQQITTPDKTLGAAHWQ
jgi:hypothetical protein